MRSTPYPIKPFRLVAVDLKKMPSSQSGVIWMAVAVCHSTKFVEAAPLRDKTAHTVADFLFREVFARYGFVRYMLSDRGTEFSNQVAQLLSVSLGVQQRFTRPYHPRETGCVKGTWESYPTGWLKRSRARKTGQPSSRQP